MRHPWSHALIDLTVLMMVSGHCVAVDWATAPLREIELFYPGQTGLEWMLDGRTHDGASRYKHGKPCRECHEGEEKLFGQRIASGQYWEDAPIAGREGYLIASMSAVTEGDRLHIMLKWPRRTSAPAELQDEEFETKVALILGDDATPDFVKSGCWVVCHQDGRGMPAATGDGELKYLPASRTEIERRVGGGKNYVSDSQMASVIASGGFLEYWQAKLNPGMEPRVLSGTILKERTEDDVTRLEGTATLEGDVWMVTFSRPLHGDAAGKLNFVPGQEYTVGLSLHDQHTSGRYHLVSFEHRMSLNGSGSVYID